MGRSQGGGRFLEALGCLAKGGAFIKSRHLFCSPAAAGLFFSSTVFVKDPQQVLGGRSPEIYKLCEADIFLHVNFLGGPEIHTYTHK